MSKFKFDSRGFIFVEVIFLALIVSFTAILVLNGLEVAIKSNRISAIRAQAINLANAQISIIEEYIEMNKTAPASSYTLLTNDDLIYEDFFGINGNVQFTIESNITSSTSSDVQKFTATVKVSWAVNDNENYVNEKGKNYEQLDKDIWIVSDIPESDNDL